MRRLVYEFQNSCQAFFQVFSELCLLRAGSWIAVGANSRGKTTHSSGYSRTQQRAQPHRMHVLLLLLQAGDGATPCLGIRQRHTSREDRQGMNRLGAKRHSEVICCPSMRPRVARKASKARTPLRVSREATSSLIRDDCRQDNDHFSGNLRILASGERLR